MYSSIEQALVEREIARQCERLQRRLMFVWQVLGTRVANLDNVINVQVLHSTRQVFCYQSIKYTFKQYILT